MIRVTVPATSANLGPGFDCLGLALSLRNSFEFTPRPAGYRFEISGEGEGIIPPNASNLVIRAARLLCRHIGRELPGLAIRQHSLVPVASGLGSSSTAVIAGLLGTNALFDEPLSRAEILALATEMEGHPDNVAPALYGGLVLVPAVEPGEPQIAERIAVPPLEVVVVLRDFEVLSSSARAALPAVVPRADAIFNLGRVPLVIRALEQGDYDKLAAAMADRLHQPYRMPLVPGLADAAAAARSAGAAAVAISGAGPSLIAFAPAGHEQIGRAICAAFAAAGLTSRLWQLTIDTAGSTVERAAG